MSTDIKKYYRTPDNDKKTKFRQLFYNKLLIPNKEVDVLNGLSEYIR